MAFTFSTPAAGNSSTGNSTGATSATGDSTTSLFGQPASSQQPSTQSVFGSATTSSGSQGGSMFGNNPGATAPSNFGAGATTNPINTAASAPSLFGGATPGGPTPSSGGLFGGVATGNPAKAASAGSIFDAGMAGNSAKPAPTGAMFGGGASSTSATTPTFSFGAPKVDQPQASGQSTPTTELPAQGLFGSTGNTKSPFGSTSTPAGKVSFALGTTTPAGVPPADTASKPAQNTTSLFGGGSQNATSNFFGAAKPTDRLTTSTAPAQPSPQTFGGLGGGSGASNHSGAPGQLAASTAAPSLFSGLNKTGQASNGTPITATTSGQTATKPSLFGTPTTKPAESASTTAPSLFGAVSAAQPATSTVTTPSLFGKPAATTTAAQAPSLFAKPAETAIASAPAPSANAGPAGTPSTAAAFGILGGAKGSSASNPGTAAASTSQPLGASTAGPAPQMSRLKNKTMDEIITRWASDLSKYQKEFQAQAEKVSAWDRLLVDNGEKIQKLYLSTYEAERSSAEVERRLTSVENQQDELSSLLDRYERNVEMLFDKEVGAQGEHLQGPDQERERVYRTAEKLDERLEEMMRDLSGMISEINDASASLSKTSKADDPLSQIVKVLNGHLNQLQWIDQNAAQLQSKVVAAQKASQAQLAQSTREGDSADDFYRSFMGGSRR